MFNIKKTNSGHFLGIYDATGCNKLLLLDIIIKNIHNYTNFMRKILSDKNVDMFIDEVEKNIFKISYKSFGEICRYIDNIALKYGICFALNKMTNSKHNIKEKVVSKLSEYFINDIIDYCDCNVNIDFSKGGIDYDLKINDCKIEVKTKNGNTFDNPNMEFNIFEYRMEYLIKNVDYILFNRSINNDDQILYEFCGYLTPKDFLKKSIKRNANDIVKIGKEYRRLQKNDYLIKSEDLISAEKFMKLFGYEYTNNYTENILKYF